MNRCANGPNLSTRAHLCLNKKKNWEIYLLTYINRKGDGVGPGMYFNFGVNLYAGFRFYFGLM